MLSYSCFSRAHHGLNDSEATLENQIMQICGSGKEFLLVLTAHAPVTVHPVTQIGEMPN